MPSPIGHALGGLAAGWLVHGPSRETGRTIVGSSTAPGARGPDRRLALWFAALAVAPDLDLLVGLHSAQTHSVGAALVVTAIVWLARRDGRLATASGLAYGSHVLLDWLGSDSSAPVGIMVLWPFSDAYYQSSLHWFMAVWRHYAVPGFWVHNIQAVARELVILLPTTGLIYWCRRPATPGGEREQRRKECG